MSSRSRAAARIAGAIAALGLLAGCGFRPVYGDWAAEPETAVQLGQVAISPIPERIGQQMRNLLIDRFYLEGGRPIAPDYRLDLRLAASESELGIQKDATATRAQLLLTAQYQLYEIGTGTLLYRSSSRSLVSYDILTDPYATLVAKDDAYERGLTRLANDVQTRLSLFFNRPDEPL